MKTSKKIQGRLKYLRGEIKAERISYDEIAELQSLAAHIPADDVELLQWAGVPENSKTTSQPAPGPLTASGTCGKYYIRDKNRAIVFETGGNFQGKPFTEDEACNHARELVLRWNSQPDLLEMLERITEKTKRANEIRHSGGKIDAEDWSELYQLTNEATAAIAKASGQ